jgi:hypothetical protein
MGWVATRSPLVAALSLDDSLPEGWEWDSEVELYTAGSLSNIPEGTYRSFSSMVRTVDALSALLRR